MNKQIGCIINKETTATNEWEMITLAFLEL